MTSPIYFKIRLFDYVNAHDVISSNALPQVKERGPYVFIEGRRKEANFINETHIMYRNIKTFVFDASLSDGTLDDNITLPNIVVLVRSRLTLAFSLNLTIWFAIISEIGGRFG